MASDEPQVIREKMWVERPTGTHLSQASLHGGFSTLARDDETNELETHATLFPITNEDDDGEAAAGDVYITNYYVADDASSSRELTDEERELLENLVVLAALMAAQVLGPRIKTLWNDRALPSIRRRWSAARTPRRRRGRKAEVEVVTAASQEPAIMDIVAAVPDEQVNMTSAEARERFLAAMRAREFSDEQLRILRSARIDVDVAPEQLQRAMEQLPSKPLNDVVSRMLEIKPASVDLAELRDALGTRRAERASPAIENGSETPSNRGGEPPRAEETSIDSAWRRLPEVADAVTHARP